MKLERNREHGTANKKAVGHGSPAALICLFVWKIKTLHRNMGKTEEPISTKSHKLSNFKYYKFVIRT